MKKVFLKQLLGIFVGASILIVGLLWRQSANRECGIGLGKTFSPASGARETVNEVVLSRPVLSTPPKQPDGDLEKARHEQTSLPENSRPNSPRSPNQFQAHAALLPHDLTSVAEQSSASVTLGDVLHKSQQDEARCLGLPIEVRTRRAGIRLRFVPSGTFEMGRGEDSEITALGHQEYYRPHRVALVRPFYLGVFPVTQREWKVVNGQTPSHFPYHDGSRPVEEVSWHDCEKFMASLCLLEGVAPGTYRLPTEAEWEYACRAGSTSAYNSGAHLSVLVANCIQPRPDDEAAELWWRMATTPVRMFPPNRWGFYDMHGNVLNWCLDWFAPYPEGSQTNPTGPADGRFKVLRGGSFDTPDLHCGSGYRHSGTPDHQYWDTGLRVLRVL